MERTTEQLSWKRCATLSFQHLFAMMGGLVVAPLILGISPSAAMFCSGIGTLLYLAVTRFRMPIFLSTSFAYVAPLLLVKDQYSPEAVPGAVIVSGAVYVVLAALVWAFGRRWIQRLMPPVVVGAVIIVIGLSSALVAVGWAGFNPADQAVAGLTRAEHLRWVAVSCLTLAVAIAGTVFFRGLFSMLPILTAIAAGYAASAVLGFVDLDKLSGQMGAQLVQLPTLTLPTGAWQAALMTVPIALVTVGEHIADVSAAGNVCKKDFISDPGLHLSLLGDGLASVLAGFWGGPPNTTYSENVGVMALTGVCSVRVVFCAALVSIGASLFAPVNQLIVNIPTPVLGGVSILLFGIITISGIRIFHQAGVDFSNNRNAIIAAVIIVLGLGNATIPVRAGALSFDIPALAIATFAGIFLNLVLPERAARADN